MYYPQIAKSHKACKLSSYNFNFHLPISKKKSQKIITFFNVMRFDGVWQNKTNKILQTHNPLQIDALKATIQKSLVQHLTKWVSYL